jgi:asparagine synthase (glutamine-hydrolysing)
VLAVAVDEARRHGLPLPVAFSLLYPGAEGTNEGDWQELVVRHLGVEDWEKFHVPPTAGELLGPSVLGSVTDHGLLWSPAVHTMVCWLPSLRGMTVLTGEGGDEILGAQRVTPLRAALSTVRHDPRRALDRRLLRRALEPLQPVAVRRKRWASNVSDLWSWLRPSAREQALHDVGVAATRQPLAWRAAVRSEPRRAAVRRGEVARRMVAGRWAVRLVDPLHDPAFVESFARQGGLLGWSGRDAAMHRLFHGLLPDAVLYRRSKAYFNRVYFGPESREVARGLTADVHPEWVDQDRLRHMWQADLVDAGVTALAQAAYLDANGLSRAGSRPAS